MQYIYSSLTHVIPYFQTYTEIVGHNFELNATFDEVDAKSYDGLILPGGRAPEYLAHDPNVMKLVTEFAKSGKVIAATCHGQLIMAAAEIVKGRKITAYPAVKPPLVAAGAHWVGPESMESNVVDGNLITAAAYFGHSQFVGHVLKGIGGNTSGSDKRILLLCGVCSSYFIFLIYMKSLRTKKLSIYMNFY